MLPGSKRRGGRARAKERAKRHQHAVGGARDIVVPHSPGDVGDASVAPDDAASGSTESRSPGDGDAFHCPLRDAPRKRQFSMEALMATTPAGSCRRPLPRVDEKTTQLLKPMPAAEFKPNCRR